MSEVTMEDVLSALGNMSVMQLIALTKELEEKWGVEAKPQTLQQEVGPGPQTETSAKSEFNVVLASYPADKKMSLIKTVREVMTLGLKEAKEFVEAVPKMVSEGVSKEEADRIKVQLEAAGGVVEVK